MIFVNNPYRNISGSNPYLVGLVQYNPLVANSNGTVGVNGTDTSITYGAHGDFQNSASFTASTSSEINLGDNNNFTLGSDWTIHIRYNSLSNTQFFLLGKRDASSNLEYQLSFIGSFATLRMRLFTDASNYRNIQYSFPVALSLNTWYTTTITSESGVLKMYTDGVDTGEVHTDTGTYTGMTNGTADLILGKYSATTTLSLNGYLGEFAIWNRALSAAEISAMPEPII